MPKYTLFLEKSCKNHHSFGGSALKSPLDTARMQFLLLQLLKFLVLALKRFIVVEKEQNVPPFKL